ncbi:His-Xaa-Ser system protein HxsD [Legionella bononiensis]|uniref:His-Xaa-Ser system protein HxsD n=1 Tax=Legionella bononiensis TaxID=2793102 RepID=A0ABS1W8T3_9GAMM|nr:His-Xaa-Ser system protein HxsD [Legionella bononiensis]MBL7479714.1 His-Xaa-Ser system protein HxsD [Legionella bononiensis]MBL7525773.1 His-Xaa-Ser system protein HxsD [Legionella bononiensis]MBL7561955.1 His-Xaa-Ser system protein HxsD [Legionella bononiensis]
MNTEEINKQSSNDHIVLNLSVYCLNVIKKAAYKFSSEFSVNFEKIDDEQINVFFDFNPTINPENKSEIIRQFQNELLDQDLREIVFKETENVRNLILAHAFSKTTLIES